MTRFGLYFRDAAPTYEFKTVALANPNIKIPPNTKEHPETIAQEFPRDMIIYRLTPHAHFRGRASQFIAQSIRMAARSCCCRCRSTTSTGRRRTR